ncbi:MAG TPA: hypothetical protein VH590_00085 [Ktedonobacterales bacterium]
METRKSLFSRRRILGIGLILSVLVLASAMLVAHALPGANKVANVAHASGGGGGSCVPTSGPSCHFQGNTALVNFFVSSPDGCVQTSGFLEVMQNVTHSPPDQTISGNTVFVSLSQDNFCTGDFLDVSGQGSGVNFQADKGLNTASLDDSFQVVDFNTGNTFTVTVNLTWQGVGAVSKLEDSTHFRTQGTMFNSHFNGTSRAANVSGTLSFGTATIASPTNFSGSGGGGGGGFFGGELQYAQGGSVDISHL